MIMTHAAGEGWTQLGELGLAFVLSGLVGLEREIRQKSAGLRTYTLVGVAAALFMLVSKYGFTDVLEKERVILDPSRVAAQIVSGIGFIGGGVIFMRRNVVRGLTTAASVWLTAALGMACGAGLLALAIATTIGHFIIMFIFPRLLRHIPREHQASTNVSVTYADGKGVLRHILVECTRLRFGVDHVRIERDDTFATAREAVQDQADYEGTDIGVPAMSSAARRQVRLSMQVSGSGQVSRLIAALSELPGIVAVGTLEDGQLD
ncbi:MgtC/SapB family protein [Novacetimonas maltaceti]|uniref:Protein MgtC n=1 Tax=Novacetimonas maltaceti TaxID=1203393 RepID=A0A2S3W5K8_9PROT|nr:MgtC/SapB family protein [Novacetimonas maltaceti]POF63823.1 putative Mg(2+) transport ATPase [Novacetimonas maltaceti]